MTTTDLPSTTTGPAVAGPVHRTVGRLVAWVRQRACRHRFAMEDLATVNDDGGADRVAWPCDKCGKVFRAHCGLDIVPENGPAFRRTPPNLN